MGAEQKHPVSKVWKPGPVTDQGSESSCVGHACYKLITSEPIVSEPFDRLTPSFIYTEAQKIDEWTGTDYDGTSVRAGLETLRKLGFVSNYFWAESAEQALEYILKFGPLILGVRWTDSMQNPDAQGRIKPKGNGGSGHAVMAYAARWREKTVTIRNSWGNWGKKGDCLLGLTDLDMLLNEGGVAAAAVEAP